MSKPGGDPSSGISSGGGLRLPERHPACRRREARLGSCMERENLHGDAKGKGTSGADRQAESTDAPVRGGLLRSSDESSVMLVERREQAIAIWIGSTGNGRNPIVNGRRQPSCDLLLALGNALASISRYTATCCATAAATHWRTPD